MNKVLKGSEFVQRVKNDVLGVLVEVGGVKICEATKRVQMAVNNLQNTLWVLYRPCFKRNVSQSTCKPVL